LDGSRGERGREEHWRRLAEERKEKGGLGEKQNKRGKPLAIFH
jgi:hypothetical protein